MLLLDLFKPIRLYVLDVYGVLTDGTILVTPDGNYLRKMNVKDGYALQLAKKKGYNIMIISGSDAPTVIERMKKLGITDVHMKVTDKLGYLREYMVRNNFDRSEVLFMGDDMPDYNCMIISGFACCPSDAAVEIKQISSYISPKRGGDGCVRDVIEKVLKLNNNWPLETYIPST